MKANKLIELLKLMVEEVGDREVEISDIWGTIGKTITAVSYDEESKAIVL